MTSDELQRWASLCRWFGLGITVIGIFVTAASHVIAERLLSVQRSERAKAQERAQASEAELRAVKQRVAWRHLSNQFAEALVGRPVGNAEIVYREGDDEAFAFAHHVEHALRSAGWKVSPPVTSVAKSKNAALPFMIREAGVSVSNWSTPIVLTAEPLVDEPYNGTTPLDALMHAFDVAGQPAFQVTPHEALRPTSGIVRIVIGSRL